MEHCRVPSPVLHQTRGTREMRLPHNFQSQVLAGEPQGEAGQPHYVALALFNNDNRRKTVKGLGF